MALDCECFRKVDAKGQKKNKPHKDTTLDLTIKLKLFDYLAKRNNNKIITTYR